MNALQLWRPSLRIRFLSYKQSFPQTHKPETGEGCHRPARAGTCPQRVVLEIYSTENSEEPAKAGFGLDGV